MVKYMFGILLFLLSCLTLSAQDKHQAQFRMSVPNQANAAFFLRNPSIEYVHLNYLEDALVRATLYYQLQGKEGSPYAVDFRDTLAKANFIDQHGHLVVPLLPSVNISFQSSIVDFVGEKNFYSVESLVKRDSVVYLFSLLKNSERKRPFAQEQGSNVARFVGDVELFENLLNKKYKLKGKTITRDSVFSFVGLIQSDSTLTNIRSETDYENKISTAILGELQRIGAMKSWHPGIQMGHNGNKFIRLHAFLLPNGRISVLTPRILRINEKAVTLE